MRSERRLVEVLTSVVRLRVIRTLHRRFALKPQFVFDHEVEDLTQEVLLECFVAERRVLRAWDPRRGASLETFIGLVAERKVRSILRSQRTNPWSDELVPHGALEGLDVRTLCIEPRVEAARLLCWLGERLRRRLNQRGFDLFIWLYFESCSIEEAARRAGMTPGALYAWRVRFGRTVAILRRDIDEQRSNSQ